MILPPLLTALHMGALHPFEQALTLILAFGPFVVLGVIVLRRRRQDAAETAEAAAAEAAQETVEAQRDR